MTPYFISHFDKPSVPCEIMRIPATWMTCILNVLSISFFYVSILAEIVSCSFLCLYNMLSRRQIFQESNTSALANWPFLTAYYTYSTNFRKSLWFDEDFDVSVSHRTARICIRHSRLDTLFWGSWIDIQYPDPDESTNSYNEIVISFGHTGLRLGVWDLVNIVRVWISLDKLLTRETNIVGEIFGPLCSCASGFLSAAFNSYSSSSHPSLYLPPLHCQPVKCIPLKYVVVDGYVLET